MIKLIDIHPDNLRQIQSYPTFPELDNLGNPLKINRQISGYDVLLNYDEWKASGINMLPKNEIKPKKKYYLEMTNVEKPEVVILRYINKGKVSSLKEACELYFKNYERYKKYESTQSKPEDKKGL